MEGGQQIAAKAEDILGVAQAMNEFMVAFAPLAEPLKIISNQLGSEIVGTNMALANELLRLLTGPLIAPHFRLLTTIFNNMGESTLKDLQAINGAIEQWIIWLGKGKTKIDEFTEAIGELEKGVSAIKLLLLLLKTLFEDTNTPVGIFIEFLEDLLVKFDDLAKFKVVQSPTVGETILSGLQANFKPEGWF